MAEAAVVAAVAPPQTCIAITQKGQQCTREVVVGAPAGGLLCFQHQSILDKQNRAIAKSAAYERARVQSDLGHEWRTRREQMPGTWEHYLRHTNNDSQFQRTLSFPQMCFMAQFFGNSYPGYASDLWRRSQEP